MALCLNSLVARQLGKLSLGISQTSVRLNHSKRKQKERVEPEFAPGHGERIWIFNHFLEGMTVYSHKPVLKVHTYIHTHTYTHTILPSFIHSSYLEEGV